jgi:hypothetical protein
MGKFEGSVGGDSQIVNLEQGLNDDQSDDSIMMTEEEEFKTTSSQMISCAMEENKQEGAK